MVKTSISFGAGSELCGFGMLARTQRSFGNARTGYFAHFSSRERLFW
jgi:hypothetical protein